MLGLDQSLLWAILLLVVGVGCIVLEMFIPSGGLLGVLATLSIVSAIFMAFLSGPLAGLVMTICVTLLIPVLLATAVQYWPHTPLGRLILLRRPLGADEVLPQTEAYRSFSLLIGKRGVAKSSMYPSGAVSVDGKTYDAVSNGLPIESGERIRVIGLDTQRLVVRTDDEPYKDLDTIAAENPLEQTLGESSLPGIDDPFA